VTRSPGTQRRPLATVPDLAAHYGVPAATVRRWHQRQTFIGPHMFRIGKYLRARWEDVDAFDAQLATQAEDGEAA
jgi:hypothetical protein